MQALRQVDILKKQLDELLPMKEEYKRELDKKIRLEFNYNSNHMEGNTLTYQETELLLIFDQSKGTHEMRELEEMKAHDVAYAMIENWASDKDHTLTEADIRSLNEIILVRPFWKDAITTDGQSTRRKIKVGQYKEQPNSVQLSNGEMFHYASPAETPIKMGELIQWYRDEEEKWELHPVALAAELHYRFVCIHPFDDGNGRISRLLMNYVLLKAALPPIVIKSSEKKNYLQALHLADVGDRAAFVDYIAEQQLWSLNLYLRAAKGHGVDELGDFEKKLLLLKSKVNNLEDVETEKTSDAINNCLEKSIVPFLDTCFTQLSKLDSLFKSKHVQISYSNEVVNGNTISLEGFIQQIHEYKYFDGVGVRIVWNSLRDSKHVDRGVSIDFSIKFLQIVYEIECSHINLRVNKLYHQILSEEESLSMTEAMGNKMINMIESIIQAE